jgi:hypothetical protein
VKNNILPAIRAILSTNIWLVIIATMYFPMLAHGQDIPPGTFDDDVDAPVGDYVVELFMLALAAGLYQLWRHR